MCPADMFQQIILSVTHLLTSPDWAVVWMWRHMQDINMSHQLGLPSERTFVLAVFPTTSKRSGSLTPVWMVLLEQQWIHRMRVCPKTYSTRTDFRSGRGFRALSAGLGFTDPSNGCSVAGTGVIPCGWYVLEKNGLLKLIKGWLSNPVLWLVGGAIKLCGSGVVPSTVGAEDCEELDTKWSWSSGCGMSRSIVSSSLSSSSVPGGK